VPRRAQLVGLLHNEQRQRRGDDVADDGKEPNQRIEAKAHAGAGEDERGVKQGRKGVDPRNAGATGARARQVEAEAIGGGLVVRPPRPQMGMRGGERKRSTVGMAALPVRPEN
jgi:hypothetical protein